MRRCRCTRASRCSVPATDLTWICWHGNSVADILEAQNALLPISRRRWRCVQPTVSRWQAVVIVLGDFNRLRDVALISYPLKHVVKAPTRKASVLDKIYTNLQDWYDQPVVLPNIGRSDHRAVLMSASVNPKREHDQDITVVRRSRDSNGMA